MGLTEILRFNQAYGVEDTGGSTLKGRGEFQKGEMRKDGLTNKNNLSGALYPKVMTLDLVLRDVIPWSLSPKELRDLAP